MEFLIVLGSYLAVAIYLFVTKRARWVRWYKTEFPALHRRGEVGGGFFAFICATWPVGWFIFVFDFERSTFREERGDNFLDRFVKRGV